MHAMIDIETLGIGHNVPMFELGVQFFSILDNGDKFMFSLDNNFIWHIDLLDVVMKTGFLPQAGTVKWWQDQEYDPTVMPRVPLYQALDQMSALFKANNVEFVWGNSPAFDLVIVGQHYAALGMEQPWNYRMELDYRTMRWLYKAKMRGDRPKEVPGMIAHNAVDDAEVQTRQLIEMFEKGLLNV